MDVASASEGADVGEEVYTFDSDDGEGDEEGVDHDDDAEEENESNSAVTDKRKDELDLGTRTLKDFSPIWIHHAYQHVASKPQYVLDGWNKSGLADCWNTSVIAQALHLHSEGKLWAATEQLEADEGEEPQSREDEIDIEQMEVEKKGHGLILRDDGTVETTTGISYPIAEPAGNFLSRIPAHMFHLMSDQSNTKKPAGKKSSKAGGAAKKAGSSPNEDVVGYGQYVTKKGLNLVCTPGNDVLATTGMAGAGATIQLFTTGLGTPTVNPISPMVKLATNTKLADKLPEIIDINCGPIISGEKTVEQMGEEVLEYIIKLASGEINTKAMDLGQDDFMFWRRGVSL